MNNKLNGVGCLNSDLYDYIIEEKVLNIKDEHIAYKGKIISKRDNKKIDMLWALDGKAMSNDQGCNLVKKIKFNG